MFKLFDKKKKDDDEKSSKNKQNGKSITVVGASTVDIVGTANSLKKFNSMSGSVKMSAGGIGRNITENCSLLGVHVNFITAIGYDKFADIVMSSLHDRGIAVNMVRRIAYQSTGVEITVNSSDKNIDYAVNHLDVLGMVDRYWIKKCKSYIEESHSVIIDCNLSHEAIDELFNIKNIDIYVMPVSASKVKLIMPYLSFVNTILLTKSECEMLNGGAIRCEQDIYEAIAGLQVKGVKNVIFINSNQDIYVSDGYSVKKISHKKVSMLSGVGAKEAFISTYATFKLLGNDFDTAIKAGVVSYIANTKVNEIVNSDLDYNYIKLLMDREEFTVNKITY